MSISNISASLPVHQPAPATTAAPVSKDPDHDGDVDQAGVPDKDSGHAVNIKA